MSSLKVDNWQDLNGNKMQNVLQVQYTQRVRHTSYTGTSWSGVIWTTITPRSATSKILVLWKISVSNGNGAHAQGRIMRNSTQIAYGTDGVGVACTNASYGYAAANTAGWEPQSWCGHWVDSPGTTSQLLYEYQVATVYSSTYTLGIGYNGHSDDDYNYNYRTPQHLTLLEIAQ